VAIVILCLATLIVLRKRITSATRSVLKKTVKSLTLDDIPLDELEMPWHKWDRFS
jgi:hypothetical protein